MPHPRAGELGDYNSPVYQHEIEIVVIRVLNQRQAEWINANYQADLDLRNLEGRITVPMFRWRARDMFAALWHTCAISDEEAALCAFHPEDPRYADRRSGLGAIQIVALLRAVAPKRNRAKSLNKWWKVEAVRLPS